MTTLWKAKVTARLDATLKLSLALVGVLGLVMLPPLSNTAPAKAIVQPADGAPAADSVRSVGGSVTSELGIIDAVSAEVTPGKVAKLRGLEGVKVYENTQVASSSPFSGYIRTYPKEADFREWVDADQPHQLGPPARRQDRHCRFGRLARLSATSSQAMPSGTEVDPVASEDGCGHESLPTAV